MVVALPIYSFILILSRILRSLILVYLIDKGGSNVLDFYQVYSLLLIFLVIVPQIISQRLVNSSLVEIDSVRFLFFNSLLIMLLSIPIITFFYGPSYLLLSFLSFYILEVPVFSNNRIKIKYKILFSCLMVFLCSGTLYWDLDLESFIKIDAIVKFVILFAIIFTLPKDLETVFYARKWKESFRNENFSLCYFFNGIIGLSKYRLIDQALIYFTGMIPLIIMNKLVEIIYGYGSILSSAIYSRNFKENKVIKFKIFKHDKLIRIFFIFAFFVSFPFLLKMEIERDFIQGAILAIGASMLLAYWWVELAFYSKIRIHHSLFLMSIVNHIRDIILYSAFIFLMYFKMTMSLHWNIFIICALLIVVLSLICSKFQRESLNEYIVY